MGIADYGGIGTLTANGQAALGKFSRHSGETAQGVTIGGNDSPVA